MRDIGIAAGLLAQRPEGDNGPANDASQYYARPRARAGISVAQLSKEQRSAACDAPHSLSMDAVSCLACRFPAGKI